MADVTIDNSCIISTAAKYNARINTYAQQIVSDSSKNTAIECSIIDNGGSFNGANFIGYVTINCNSKDDISTLNISKKLEFKKKISPKILLPLFKCSIVVRDIYDSNNKQVDLTR